MNKLFNLNGLFALRLSALFFIIICTQMMVNAQINYDASTIFSGENPSIYKSADINQDGAVDILITQGGLFSKKIFWLENDGNENFTAHPLPSLIFSPTNVDCADLNNDGAIDIIATIDNVFGNYAGVVWYENDGNENFNPHIIDANSTGSSLFLIDLDNNGTMDIISSDGIEGSAYWYDNNGSGQFTKRIFPESQESFAVKAADLDHDGDNDLIMYNNIIGTVVWYENDGNENFSLRFLDESNTILSIDIVLDDLNGDGFLDVIMRDFYTEDFLSYENNGSGSFTRNIIPAIDRDYYSFSTFDWEGDGDKDILASSFDYSSWSGFISVWVNDGNENFTRNDIIDNNFSYSNTNAVDIDDDGDQDIIGDSGSNIFLFKACNAINNNTPPTLACKHPTITLDANGQYTFTNADLVQSSADDCGPVTFVSASPAMVDCADVSYTLPVMVTVQDEAGNTANCTANVTVEEGTSLPNDWQGTNIGQSGTNNDYSYSPCSQTQEPAFTVTGGGNNTSSMNTDNVAFSSYSICGDGSITAKIESVDPNGYGGLMIRESMDAGAKQVSVFSNMTNNLRHESRSNTNGMKQVNSFFKPSPIWLKLERQGDWVFAYYSSTGANFQYVHAVFVPMQSCVEFGLASFTYLPGSQTEAVFSNVSIIGSNGGNGSNNNSIVNNESNQEPSFGTASNLKPETLPNTGPSGNLFPNPNKGQFTLKMDEPTSKEGFLTIYTPYGQQLHQQPIEAGFTQKQIDLGSVPAGMYLLEYQDENAQRIVKKFTISK